MDHEFLFLTQKFSLLLHDALTYVPLQDLCVFGELISKAHRQRKREGLAETSTRGRVGKAVRTCKDTGRYRCSSLPVPLPASSSRLRQWCARWPGERDY